MAEVGERIYFHTKLNRNMILGGHLFLMTIARCTGHVVKIKGDHYKVKLEFPNYDVPVEIWFTAEELKNHAEILVSI